MRNGSCASSPAFTALIHLDFDCSLKINQRLTHHFAGGGDIAHLPRPAVASGHSEERPADRNKPPCQQILVADRQIQPLDERFKECV